MASTAMPQITHTSTRPFPSEKPYFGGRSGQPGRSSLGGSRKCALLYCLQQYLRAPSGGPARRIRMRQAGANRSGSSKGCGPCAAKRLSRGGDGARTFPRFGKRQKPGAAMVLPQGRRGKRELQHSTQITKTYTAEINPAIWKGEHHHTQGNHRTNHNRRGAAGPRAAPAAADGKPTKVPR